MNNFIWFNFKINAFFKLMDNKFLLFLSGQFYLNWFIIKQLLNSS